MSLPVNADSAVDDETKRELRVGFEVQGALNGGMIVFSPRYGFPTSRILGSFSTPQDMLAWLTSHLTEGTTFND